MANEIREALTVTGQSLTLFCGGMSKVGFRAAGTWVGTVRFYFSPDGVQFFPLAAAPFPASTPVFSSTANGIWEAAVQNNLAVKMIFTRTSGTLLATIAASIDGSYQNAFLDTSVRFPVSSHAAGAANVLTVAAVASRAFRIRSVTQGFSAAPAAAVLCTIKDGTQIVYETYVPAAAGDYKLNLPLDPNAPGMVGGGVLGTAGNAMTITTADPGGAVVSKINAEVSAA